MRNFNAYGMAPNISMLDKIGTRDCYVRLAEAWRTVIHIQLSGMNALPYTHQFVFDSRMELDILQVRDSSTGDVVVQVLNLCRPAILDEVENA